ncbi:MAG: hypothetical protein M1833_000744 [Piccolia ochrophora]|nr:MAG: hypothetical protein M1833_000744 [Piccolia ochrophora]
MPSALRKQYSIMDRHDPDAFVNRDDPIPTIAISDHDETTSGSETKPGKRRRLRTKLSASGLKGRVQDGQAEKGTGASLQDRMFAKLLQQLVPMDDLEQNQDTTDRRSSKYVSRPGFSLPLMTSNFRRFNARIGIVFVFQNRLIRLLSWKMPTHTLSFLALYSFLCLNPYLLSVLPLAATVLFVMVPSFIVRHPPAPTDLPTDSYSAHGPPVAPPRDVKPVSEMSKDFFRNMRDLQNSMEDFSRIHDTVLKMVAPPTNFSNEILSSTIFLFLFATACIMFIASHLLPWRAIFLVAGWTATCLGHPTLQHAFLTTHEDHLRPRERQAESWLNSWMERDITLDIAPEQREVEIFELQRHSGGGEWESWIFSPSPYDPLSSERVSGSRAKGTRFFEDVQPPHGWEWRDKKWTLDLSSREWVEERMITGVEIETEGERWVYDLSYQDESGEFDGYGEQNIVIEPRKKSKGKESRTGWDEGIRSGQRGEWKRRRWVRYVSRSVLGQEV